MKMSQLYEKLMKLNENERQELYKSDSGVIVSVTHTGKHSNKDFAVGLVIGKEAEFYPSHIRVLIDFYIKRESNYQGSKTLFNALEQVYKGADPVDFLDDLHSINFPMQLDEAEVNLYVAQLLMIEQDFNFGPGAPKKSKLDPPREYLMRFFRWIASNDNQIDRIIFAAAGRKYPAPDKYSKPVNFE